MFNLKNLSKLSGPDVGILKEKPFDPLYVKFEGCEKMHMHIFTGKDVFVSVPNLDFKGSSTAISTWKKNYFLHKLGLIYE